MIARTYLFLCITAAWSLTAVAESFHEGWETAEVTDYVPSSTSYIDGDEGFWFLGDSVSQSPECGQTRNQAQIFVENGSRVLRLLSNRSFTNCADDVWVLLSEFESFNEDFAIPLTPNTTIFFNERGELEDPQLHNGGVNCVVPPCFDNVSLLLTDNGGNILAYVLQRYPAAVENTPNVNYGDTYREIFLDPDAGTYRRNLYEDFQTIRTFDPRNPQIRAIEFRVDEHGVATLDNLIIDSGEPAGSAPVHRFWSPVLLSHFYTIDEAERQLLVTVYPHIWTYEGIAYRALPNDDDPNSSPVYRFWSPVLLSHFYTIDEAERDLLLRAYPDVWTPEGIAFYAFAEDSQPEDAVPVYRFWSPVLLSHFYTADEAERDLLLRAYPDVWTPEGIAWYAYRP